MPWNVPPAFDLHALFLVPYTLSIPTKKGPVRYHGITFGIEGVAAVEGGRHGEGRFEFQLVGIGGGANRQ